MWLLQWLPLLLLPCLCAAEDPFAMFESELPAPPAPPAAAAGAAACCGEAARCRRLLTATGPLRARWATRPRRPAPARRQVDRRQVNSAFMQRHVMRTLKLLRLDGDAPAAERETFLLTARVTEVQVLRLRQFLSRAGDVPLVEVDAILEEVLAESELESLLTEGRPRWLRRLATLVPQVSPELLPVMLAAALALWLLIALLVGRSWGYVLSRLALVLLLVSFLWHWNHLYKLALAERHLRFNPPEGCEAADRGWTDGLLHYVRGLVSFVKPDQVCREYYSKLHVDPFLEVSPGLAVVETLTKMVLHPAEQLGRALGRFYSALAAEVPTLYLVPLIVISLAFILGLTVIVCRCRPPAAARGCGGGVDPLHVTVAPGEETVYLVVTEEGQVRPVGEAARRRTTVERAGPERGVGWLAWTGRGLARSGGGLARSLSTGALVAGGAVSAGTRALLARRTAVEAVEEAEGEEEIPPAHPKSRHNVPRHQTAKDDSAVGRVTSARPSPPPVTGDGGGGGDGDGRVSTAGTHTSPVRSGTPAAPAAGSRRSAAGDRPRVEDVCTATTPERPDTAAAGDSPMTPAGTPVMTSVPPMTSVSPMMPAGADPAGGGDAGSPGVGGQRLAAAEVAPRGGGDESYELPASPFLTRIKEVMDTSLEDAEG